MPNYRVILEYDGTRYHGWQVQKNARSIAGEMRRAVETAGGVIVELGGSGRTDAGVHALAQSAHLRLRSPVDAPSFRIALNDVLPPDIHVLGLYPAAEGFHSRHDAVSRSYLYQISRRRTAHAKRWVWWIRRHLDAPAMVRAAALIEGRHDFALFCERPSEQPGTLVVVERCEVAETGDLILVRLVASHFLWKMVRRLVGTLVRIATGELEIDSFASLLAARPPAGMPEGIARWTAPASGLFLERVLYPGEPPLRPLAPIVPVEGEPREAGAIYTGRDRRAILTHPEHGRGERTGASRKR